MVVEVKFNQAARASVQVPEPVVPLTPKLSASAASLRPILAENKPRLDSLPEPDFIGQNDAVSQGRGEGIKSGICADRAQSAHDSCTGARVFWTGQAQEWPEHVNFAAREMPSSFCS